MRFFIYCRHFPSFFARSWTLTFNVRILIHCALLSLFLSISRASHSLALTLHLFLFPRSCSTIFMVSFVEMWSQNKLQFGCVVVSCFSSATQNKWDRVATTCFHQIVRHRKSVSVGSAFFSLRFKERGQQTGRQAGRQMKKIYAKHRITFPVNKQTIMLLNGGINMFAWSITVPFKWNGQINAKLACIRPINITINAMCVLINRWRRSIKNNFKNRNDLYGLDFGSDDSV